MHEHREIIVVAADEYKDLGRRLSHEISKVEGCNCAYWSPRQFEDNEFQLGGNRYAVFIGNTEENALTKDFLPVIKELHNEAGACYGFDGCKAVVFGEGKLEQRDDFRDVAQATVSILAATASASTTSVGVGSVIALGTIGVAPVWFAGGFLGAFGYGIYRLWSYWSEAKQRKKLRKDQTEVALTLFFAQCFTDWVGMSETEKRR